MKKVLKRDLLQGLVVYPAPAQQRRRAVIKDTQFFQIIENPNFKSDRISRRNRDSDWRQLRKAKNI